MTNKQTGTSGLVESAIRFAIQLVGKEADEAMHVRRANRDVVEGIEAHERALKRLLASLSPAPVDEVERLVGEWERLEGLFHDAIPDQGDPGDGGKAGRALCQFLYDNSEQLRAALTASRPSDDGWMLIETAPKDGTVVLAWADGCGMESVRGYGVKDERGKLTWLTGDGFNATWPTHWRPLPDPPAALSSLVGEK